MKQDEEILWALLQCFYPTLSRFKTEYRRYRQVLEGGLSHKDTCSDPLKEVSVLIHHYDYLKDLKEEHLEDMKKLCDYFLEKNGFYHSTLLPYYIHDLYHEFCILLQNIYKIKIGEQNYMEFKNEEEFKVLIGSVNVSFPDEMTHILILFQETQNELEKIVISHKESTILVRSLFLFGEEIFHTAGLGEFVKKIYPDQMLEMYTRASFSFYSSGFFSLAKKAATKALEFLNEQAQSYNQWKEKLDMVLSEKKSENICNVSS